MEMVSGYQVFSKEEMNNENAIKVFSDMIQNWPWHSKMERRLWYEKAIRMSERSLL